MAFAHAHLRTIPSDTIRWDWAGNMPFMLVTGNRQQVAQQRPRGNLSTHAFLDLSPCCTPAIWPHSASSGGKESLCMNAIRKENEPKKSGHTTFPSVAFRHLRKDFQMTQIFCDLDGVMAAFDEHVDDLFGVSTRSISDPVLWGHVNSIPDFWISMPLKADAGDLWDEIKHQSPIFLSGCPRIGYEAAETQKRLWVRKHFGNVPLITCRSKDKPSHMRAQGDVLIDDFVANVKRWEKAGGRPIYHRDAASTIERLRSMMGSN